MNKLWKAQRLEFDLADQAQDHFFNSGWTDGLPVVPPTEEKVRVFLDTVALPPQEILGGIPERNRVFTAEKAAINAVMAGCLPEYFPVVVAAVKAMTQPAFGLHGVTATTGGAAVLLIVNGPLAGQIGLNCGQNVFGPGTRANAAIGRALRLVLHNLGGREFDRGTMGHPGKYTFCIAEDEDSRWEPLQVSRGFSKETSTVTVFAAEGPNQVQNHGALKPENILLTLADRMRSLGSFNMLGDTQAVVVICREHYQTLIQDGWDKARVRQFLFEKAVRPLADLKRGGLLETPIVPEDELRMVRAVSAPEHILLVQAGGVAGRFSAFIPGWGGRHMSSAVTWPIEGGSCSGGV